MIKKNVEYFLTSSVEETLSGYGCRCLNNNDWLNSCEPGKCVDCSVLIDSQQSVDGGFEYVRFQH